MDQRLLHGASRLLHGRRGLTEVMAAALHFRQSPADLLHLAEQKKVEDLEIYKSKINNM